MVSIGFSAGDLCSWEIRIANVCAGSSGDARFGRSRSVIRIGRRDEQDHSRRELSAGGAYER